MVDEDKEPTGKWPKELDPRLKEFIDRAIVPILGREWFKEQTGRAIVHAIRPIPAVSK